MFVFNGSRVIPFGYYPRPSRDRGRAGFRSGLKGAFEREFELSKERAKSLRTAMGISA
jgi:hypothetical protein